MHNEEFGSSLPYIDDANTDDDDVSIEQCSYNVKIVENYQNQNRNIQITKHSPDELTCQSLSPVAPLAEETEFSDSLENEVPGENLGKTQPSMKFVIKGWNSTIKIQGLDKKSSITFKKNCEESLSGTEQTAVAVEKKKNDKNKKSLAAVNSSKTQEKSKKGKWRTLTRSIVKQSAKFERRVMDERYPKYVLLKNEEENVKEKMRKDLEKYPKMIVISDQSKNELANEKQKETTEKLCFEEKKDFCDDTTDSERPKNNKENDKTPQTSRHKKINKEALRALPVNEASKKTENINSRRRNSNFNNQPILQPKITENESKSVVNVSRNLKKEDEAFNKGEDRLSDVFDFPSDDQFHFELQPNTFEQPFNSSNCPSAPRTCGGFCCRNLPPTCHPVYNHSRQPQDVFKKSDFQACEREFDISKNIENSAVSTQIDRRKGSDFEEVHFGMLSSFLPSSVIFVKAFHPDNIDYTLNYDAEKEKNCGNHTVLNKEVNENTILESVELHSRITPNEEFAEVKMIEAHDSGISSQECLASNNDPGLEEDIPLKPSTSDVSKSYIPNEENELRFNKSSITPKSENEYTREEIEDKKEEASKLTKIGYKMYDNLSKLSLKREQETVSDKPEANGCGSEPESETRKIPYNIVLESDNRVIRVTVPENQLNFQIVDSQGPDIRIGVGKAKLQNGKEKMVVRRDELWYGESESSKQTARIYKRWSGDDDDDDDKVSTRKTSRSPKIQLSIGESQGVLLSIETDNKEAKIAKTTKEVKIGTEDFEIAGRDSNPGSGKNQKNLSPRKSRLLRNLQEKLKCKEQESNSVPEPDSGKIVNEKANFGTSVHPDILLVQKITSSPCTSRKAFQVSSLKKSNEESSNVGKLREYYCEECMATMRIFEDENPSVKTMIDKFETIIQLESY